MCGTLLPVFCPAQVNSGSNGSDGAFNPTATNTVINMADHPDGIYQYTSVNIPAGVTVSFVPNASNTPVVWLVQNSCNVAGTVALDGKTVTNSAGAAGGPGGFVVAFGGGCGGWGCLIGDGGGGSGGAIRLVAAFVSGGGSLGTGGGSGF